MRRTIAFFLLGLTLALEVPGQVPTDREVRLNTHRLTVSIEMSRNQFIVGEELVYAISVHNATGRSMRVLTPFDPRNGTIRFLVQGTDSSGREVWRHLDPVEPSVARLPLRTTDIAPGERLMATVRFDTGHCGALVLRCAAPDPPGNYELLYEYGPESRARFAAVELKASELFDATLERRHILDVPDRGSFKGGQLVRHRKVRTAVLLENGTSVLVTSLKETFHGPNGKVTFLDLFPFRRIQEGRSIRNLRTTVTPTEEVTVQYDDDRQKDNVVRLNNKKEKLP